MKKQSTGKQNLFENFSGTVTRATGSTAAFLLALSAVIIWAITGPLFHYSENWQLVINTGTTIITFLMVFLIQKSQNKDSLAIQLKLDELLAANEKASNKLVDAENMTEEEMKVIKKYYARVNARSAGEADASAYHSLDEEKES